MHLPKGHTAHYRQELQTKHQINAKNQKRPQQARE